MSEYQYYEFLAVDAPLSAAQVAAVRRVSTRADITATRFVNEYQWGDFKGDVDAFLRDYYDCHVHVTNWGTRRFAFRLPADLVDRKVIEAYAHADSLAVRPAGEWLIVDIDPRDESGDWDDPADADGWMGSLATLRSEVLAGDLRPLYLGWLAGVGLSGPSEGDDDADDEDDRPTPPPPAGLGKLTAAQRALAEYVNLPPELLEVAAAGSPPPTPPADLAAAIRVVPPAEKDAWLLDLLSGRDPLAVARVRRQLMPHPAPAVSAPTPSVGRLRRAWRDLADTRARDGAAAAGVAKRERDAAAAAARERRLADLAARGADAPWRDVDAFIAEKNRDGYAKAVAVLLDLRALADRPGGDPAGFQARLDRVLKANTRRSSFMAAARQATLTPSP